MVKFDNYQTRYRPGLDLVLKGKTWDVCFLCYTVVRWYNIDFNPILISTTEGPCLMQLLGLEKSRISQISLLQFAFCEFWAIYFISVIFLAKNSQKIALMKYIAQNLHKANCSNATFLQAQKLH